jgi:hypothetical protein
MKLRADIPVLLALASLLPCVAHAGAWVQKKDGYYLKVSSSYLSSAREFNVDGDEVDILSGDTLLTDTSYRDISVGIYLEYGLTDRLTAVASLPFKVLRSRRTELSVVPGLTRDVDAETGGLADASLGLRYPIATAPFPVAVEGSVKLPLGYADRPDNGGPPLGTSHVDIEARLLAGVSLYPFPGYVTGGVGYRVKTGDLDDEIDFSIEGGASWKRLGARIGLGGSYSTGDPPDISRSEDGRVSSTVHITDQDVLMLTPGLSFSFNDEIALVAEAFHTLSGRNTVAGTTFALGVVYTQ